MPEVKIYTPSKFLYDVRDHVIDTTDALSKMERYTLRSTSIHYIPAYYDSKLKEGAALLMGDCHYAQTHLGFLKDWPYYRGNTGDKGWEAGPIDIYGREHANNQVHLAHTLVHEMGHALTHCHSHDEIWAAKCAILGIKVFAYEGDMLNINHLDPRQWEWSNCKLLDWVKARPKVEWD